MGYFSNGTEGELYRERWCERCVHDGNHDDDPFCPIWNLHLEHAYTHHDHPLVAPILNELIPRAEDGLSNKQCSMFVEQHETPLLDAAGLEVTW